MTPSVDDSPSRDFTLVPAWLFYGRDAEGTVRFTVRLPVGDVPDEAYPAGDPYPAPVESEEAYPSP